MNNTNATPTWLWKYVFIASLTFLVSGWMLHSPSNKENSVESQQNTNCLDIAETATVVGLDLVLPIEQGGVELKTGDFVYDKGDHNNQDRCALDFLDIEGRKIVAVEDGQVIGARWYKCKQEDIELECNYEDENSVAYGYYVFIEHIGANGNKYHSLYAHLKNPSEVPLECRVRPNVSVEQGDCIGIAGATGIGGPHLHFAMFEDDFSIGSDNAPFKGTPLAPESMKGLHQYSTLSSQKTLRTISIAELVSVSVPATLTQTQSAEITFRNISESSWDTNDDSYELILVSGEAPHINSKIPLQSSISAGHEAEINIPIVIDENIIPAVYQSEWQLHHNGVAFGPMVKINYAVFPQIDGSEFEIDLDSLWNLLFNKLIQIAIDAFNSWYSRNIAPICGAFPLSLIILAVVLNQKREKDSNEIKPSKPADSWVTIFKKITLIAVYLTLSYICFLIYQELSWWEIQQLKRVGLITGIGSALWLILALYQVALTTIKVYIKIGGQRMILFLISLGLVFIINQGNKYHDYQQIPNRYLSASEDLVYITQYHLANNVSKINNEVKEFNLLYKNNSQDNTSVDTNRLNDVNESPQTTPLNEIQEDNSNDNEFQGNGADSPPPNLPRIEVLEVENDDSGGKITLIEPIPYSIIKSGNAEQRFIWNYNSQLADNQHFEIRFYHTNLSTFQSFGWVKETEQTINLNNLPNYGEYQWQVVIVQGRDGNWENDVLKTSKASIIWEN